MLILKIAGVVKSRETGMVLPGLYVKAYDKDLIFDDVLGSAVSDLRGKFEIFTEIRDFSEIIDRQPDLYFRVYGADRKHQIHSTEDAVKWNATALTNIEILIPGTASVTREEAVVQLLDANHKTKEVFSVGESLVIAAEGLAPGKAHEIRMSVDGTFMFESRLMTNTKGQLEPTVIWPQMGLFALDSNELYTPEQAAANMEGKSVELEILMDRTVVSTARIRMGESAAEPVIISSTSSGRLLNGFEAEDSALFMTIRNVPHEGDARVMLVTRQHRWNAGDPLEIVLNRDGRPVVMDMRLGGAGQQTFELASAGSLWPGAYDFIIRPIEYGWEDNDELHLLPRDFVGGRLHTGVVIRDKFWGGKPVLGGCVNKLPVSGRTVWGAPYFRYSDAFTVGENVYAGLDPGIVDPGNISKMCALYVIPSKDAAQWAMNNSLSHLPVLGGNPAVMKVMMTPGCMNYNVHLVWPNASIPGDYDIVADFGNNTGIAANFVNDDQYNTPLDIIDGYFLTGFKVVEDPGTMSPWANVGTWHYNEADVAGLGLMGTVNVNDENTGYFTPGAFVNTVRSLPLRARVFYPADAPGQTGPANISAVNPNYPLVVVVHGNGQDYDTYDLLCTHLAHNGFIAVSIDNRYTSGMSTVHGMHGLGRAENLFKHLQVIQTGFGATVQNNIGIMGHSRGGEAVIKATRINQQSALGFNINAVIALAPTDQYGSENISPPWAKPYYVIYGSRDGDISGAVWTAGYTVGQTGMAQWDRSSGSQKVLSFVYKATHNGFITTNYDYPPSMDDATPAAQQAFSFAYMNAYFRMHLRAETQWEGMFTGEWKPGSVAATGLEFYQEYSMPGASVVDDFQSNPAWNLSSSGGAVTHNATLPVNPSEDRMCEWPGVWPTPGAIPGLDLQSPHDTKGMKVRWDNWGQRLEFTIQPGMNNVSAFTHVALRVTQKTGSPSNPAGQTQDLRVVLRDGAANERAVRVSAFSAIPPAENRPYDPSLNKSALLTVRIPLKSYTIVCAGQVQVDLTNVVQLALLFDQKVSGEIEIDNIEFTN